MITKQPTLEAHQATLSLQNKMDERKNNIPRSLKARTQRDQLIESQLWKARKSAQYFAKKTGLRYDDLYLEACLGLVKLYESWKPEKGSNFSTYVNRSLNFLLMNYLRDKTYIYKIPRQMSVDNLKLNKAKRALPEGSEKEWAEFCGFKVNYVSELQDCFQTHLSLDFEDNEENN